MIENHMNKKYYSKMVVMVMDGEGRALNIQKKICTTKNPLLSIAFHHSYMTDTTRICINDDDDDDDDDDDHLYLSHQYLLILLYRGLCSAMLFPSPHKRTMNNQI